MITTSSRDEVRIPRLKLDLRLFQGDSIAMGQGKADLLEAIESAGSISAASRTMNMSYRRAWLLVDEMNRCFNMPLVETARGGTHGGGATLTPFGSEVLAHYRAMITATRQVAAAHLELFENLMCHHPAETKTPSAKVDC